MMYGLETASRESLDDDTAQVHVRNQSKTWRIYSKYPTKRGFAIVPLKDFFENTLWPRLKEPVLEIVVHLAVTVLSVLSIAVIELLLYILHVGGETIPGTALLSQRLGLQTGVTLNDWMLVLEVVAATAIIVVGLIKAVKALL
jgi:hypothetical protein